MADFASAARNAPSEDGKCWQRVELGLHGLRSWGRNWSRKVRETWNSGGLQRHEGGRGHLLSGAREARLAPNVPSGVSRFQIVTYDEVMRNPANKRTRFWRVGWWRAGSDGDVVASGGRTVASGQWHVAREQGPVVREPTHCVAPWEVLLAPRSVREV